MGIEIQSDPSKMNRVWIYLGFSGYGLDMYTLRIIGYGYEYNITQSKPAVISKGNILTIIFII